MAPAVAGAGPDVSASRTPQSSRPVETSEQRQKRKDAERKKLEQSKKDKSRQAPASSQKAVVLARPAEAQHFTRQTPFVCNIRFRNDLPEIPCDPKMLVTPVQPERLAEFRLTKLELEGRHEMPVPLDLGIPISALDIQRYAVPDIPEPLDPADEVLLQGDTDDLQPEQPLKGARTRGKAAPVNLPWLMNTTYIQGAHEAKRGAALQKLQAMQAAEGAQPLDERAIKIAEIEEGFQAASRPPVHQTDPHLTPLEVLPVFPDDDVDAKRSVVIIFDGDPTADDAQLSTMAPNERLRLTEHSIVKSYNYDEADGRPSRFVAFLSPSDPNFVREDAAPHERDLFGNAAEVGYRWIREYNYDIKLETEAESQSEYLFRFQPNGVFYTTLGGRLTLRKRSKFKGSIKEVTKPSKITLKRDHDAMATLPEGHLQQDLVQGDTAAPSQRQRTGLSSSDEDD